MAKEVERKFLMRTGELPSGCDHGTEIMQAYLSEDPDSTVRIRVYGQRAYLTVKSRNDGISRHEWEYEIPVNDAKEMISNCRISGVIEKTRYKLGRWEIDKFHGRHDGLIVAEIELNGVDEQISLPDFIGREVSDDPRYFNSILASCRELPPFE